jgi:hypothetical protein
VKVRTANGHAVCELEGCKSLSRHQDGWTLYDKQGVSFFLSRDDVARVLTVETVDDKGLSFEAKEAFSKVVDILERK